MGVDPLMAVFAFAIAISPGPSNVLLLAAGSRLDLRAGLALLVGMALGYAGIWAISASSLRALAELDPLIIKVAKWAAVLLMGWLAVRLCMKLSASGSDDADGARIDAVGIWDGFAFQLSNPKAWTTAFAASALFCSPALGVEGHAIVFGAIVGIAVLIGCGVWLLAGRLGGAWLRRPAIVRVLNASLIATIVASAVPIVIA